MMKLSEAIRLGALLRPQAFGALVDEDGNTCAFGAALEAIGWIPSMDSVPRPWMDPQFWDSFPVQDEVALHPIWNRSMYISSIVVDLNNQHHWTRERIADWVETIENAQEQATPVIEQESVLA